MSKFDTIGLINQSTLPSAVAGDVVFQASKLRVYNGSSWETFSAVSPSGDSNTITMGASQQVLAEGGSTNPSDGAPSYAFSGDTDTGLWNPSDGTVRIASDGNGVAEFEHGTGMTMLTGQVLGTDGSVGAPSFSNDGDENTGMWFPADDTIAFSTAGNQAFTILPSGLVQVNTASYENLLANDNDIPNKAYVDSLSAGLDPKGSVRVATTGDLDTETGLGTWGASGAGQGKTLTAGAAGALVLDTSVTCVLGDRVLVKNESAGLGADHNGIYDVTTDGNALPEITVVDFTSHTITDGNYWLLKSANDATSYYVWYGTTDPTPGGTGLQVALQGSPSAYATATKAVVDAAGGAADFNSVDNGNLLTVTNQATGPTTDAADVNASVAITVSQDGKAVSATVMTRADDQDGTPANEVSGGNFTTVEAGTSLAGSMWAVVWDGDIVVDTDDINWTQIGGSLPSSGYPLLAPVSATPQYSFIGDTDTGMGSTTGDILYLKAGNTQVISYSSTIAQSVVLSRGPDGADSGPTYSFANATNLGMYYDSGNGSVAFAVGGSKIAEFTSLALDGNALYLRGRGGSAGNPGVSFSVDDDTGMYRSNADEIGFATGGEQRVNISNTGMNLKADTGVEYELRFEDGTDGTYVGLKSPDNVTTQTVWSLPVDDGSSNQALITDGSAALGWATVDLVTELSVSTSDDTENELVGPGTTYFTITDETAYAVELLVMGRKEEGDEHAMWKILVGIERTGGTVALVGSDATTTINNAPGWSVAVSADDTNKRLAVKVTGGAATTNVEWKAKITAVSVLASD